MENKIQHHYLEIATQYNIAAKPTNIQNPFMKSPTNPIINAYRPNRSFSLDQQIIFPIMIPIKHIIANIMKKTISSSELITSPQYTLSIVPKIGTRNHPENPNNEANSIIFPKAVCFFTIYFNLSFYNSHLLKNVFREISGKKSNLIIVQNTL